MKRRTHPGLLSAEETARDRRRTEEMVGSFSIGKQVTRIGETSNFAVDFNGRERLVMVYGKEIPRECPFKLAFNEAEIKAIMPLLTKARAFFNNH